MSGSLIGVCSAVGALGGVAINLALRQSYLSTGTETSAYWVFLASYVVAAALTWMVYVRRPAPAPGLSGDGARNRGRPCVSGLATRAMPQQLPGNATETSQAYTIHMAQPQTPRR